MRYNNDVLNRYCVKHIYLFEAHKWDRWYSKYFELKIFESKAIRVEQGEYAVVSHNTALGTYNVRQCVVLYLATVDKHGMAHIDGHTEIKSLTIYLSDLGIVRGSELPSHIKIIGAWSSDVMGLNDSEANIRKVVSFLKGFFREQNSGQIDALAHAREKKIDFVIEWSAEYSQPIVHDETLALGGDSKVQALHTIQEIKRKDGYLGTYPIARANDGHSNCVFLDERAIVKLKEYLKNPEKDKPRDTNDSYYYGAFDSAIPVILEEWKKCTNNYTVPLLIGDDAYTLNNMTTSTIRYTNSANINLVLDYCKKIDPGLDISLVKQRISEKYQQNTVIYDYGVFSFDGAISAKFLISVILECSSKLKKLLMLNSQGGCNLDNKFYKISEIKQVLNDQELLVLASCVQNYNVTIETSNLSNLTIEERNQHVDMQLQCRGVQLKRKQKLLFAQKKYTIDQSVEKACEDQPLDYQEVLNSVKRRCEETKQDKIKALQITDDSEFAKIKDEFLNALDPKPEVFSSTTIGMYLSEHADSLYFCYNLDIAENSAAVRFYNEGVSLMALIHSNSSEW